MASFIRAGAAAALIMIVALAGCGRPTDDIRTVADFDANPCALFTDTAMAGVVTSAYQQVAQATPTLSSAKPDDGGGAHSCVYAFVVPGAVIPQMASLTVVISHMDSGNRPLAICAAGAQTNSGGYELQPFGDQSCMTPTADLWMRVGTHYFHIVVNPQPGFADAVDRAQAIGPIIDAVGSMTADLMPKV